MSSMDKSRRILTPTERDAMNRQLAQIDADKRGEVEGVPRRMQGFLMNREDKNQRLLDQQERRIKRVLDEGTPDSLDDESRVRMEKRATELSEQLSKRMVTKSQIALKPGSIEFRRAVNQMAQEEMSAGFNEAATEWKNIRRQLLPDDPDASNLETIRPA